MRLRLALLLLPVLSACERAATPVPDPYFREPSISGLLYRLEYYDWTVEYYRDVDVFDNDGFRMVPVVMLNQFELRTYAYSPTRYRYGDNNWFRVYQTYNLSVRHYWGEAFARVVMPGNFEITTPPDRHILDRDSTLVITWRSSPGAQWYWLDLFCDYDYIDSNGIWQTETFELDTVLRDTVVMVPAGRLFPRRVVELVSGDGSAMVVAAYGPEVEPGDIGNVRGVGFGFFSAANEPRERYFYVGAPPRARRAARPEVRRERFRNRVRIRRDED